MIAWGRAPTRKPGITRPSASTSSCSLAIAHMLHRDPSMRATFGGLPGAYWALWTGTLINRLGGFVQPFLAIYLTTERGLGIDVAGTVVALLGAGSLAA